MSLYHKIYSPFKRVIPEGGKELVFDVNQWYVDEFGELAGNNWDWSEKIDGMNVRVIWDGHKPTFGGRTDNAMFKAHWTELLEKTFPEVMLEEKFGETPAVLFGELFGQGIQSGTPYGKLPLQVAIFDVKVGEWWLLPDAVKEICESFGVNSPEVQKMSVWGAIGAVKTGVPSQYGDFISEGLVGRAPLGLKARNGARLVMKVKDCDFRVPAVSVPTAPLA